MLAAWDGNKSYGSSIMGKRRDVHNTHTWNYSTLGSIIIIPTAESVSLHSIYKFLSAIAESYVQGGGRVLMNYESSVPEDLIFRSVFCTKLLKCHE